MRSQMTVRDKYMNDPEYRSLVDMLEQFVERARFSPSELREAAVLACINYEMRHIRDMHIDPRTNEAFIVLEEFIYGKGTSVRRQQCR